MLSPHLPAQQYRELATAPLLLLFYRPIYCCGGMVYAIHRFHVERSQETKIISRPLLSGTCRKAHIAPEWYPLRVVCRLHLSFLCVSHREEKSQTRLSFAAPRPHEVFSSPSRPVAYRGPLKRAAFLCFLCNTSTHTPPIPYVHQTDSQPHHIAVQTKRLTNNKSILRDQTCQTTIRHRVVGRSTSKKIK